MHCGFLCLYNLIFIQFNAKKSVSLNNLHWDWIFFQQKKNGSSFVCFLVALANNIFVGELRAIGERKRIVFRLCKISINGCSIVKVSMFKRQSLAAKHECHPLNQTLLQTLSLYIFCKFYFMTLTARCSSVYVQKQEKATKTQSHNSICQWRLL